MALIPVFYTASTKDIAEKSHEQGILKYPGICWIQDIETIVYVSSDNELHYAKGNEQIDKVIGAVSGHLPALNDDGSLVDSGKSPDDFDEAGAAASALADAKSYINKKISELINGAPETADTLKELSDLVSQNKDVITSLDTLLSKKADITAIPTTLPNPNALTFSGLVEGNYDGSEAVNIEVPQDMWIHVTIGSSGHISERDTTFEEIDNYYTSHPNNNIFMSCLINNIECIGTLESVSPGNSYTFGVMSYPTADVTVNGITKKSITIYENDGYGIYDNILSIPYVSVSGDITFERAVCELLAKANIGYVTTSDKYYLVIKTNFDRGRGGCLVYDEHEAFKLYSYTLMNGEEWTITPTSSPNIISITRGNHGAYKSSLRFSTIKKINPENMLVCYNNTYGRLVSMDDNEAVFKIPSSTNNPDIHICINSDNSVKIIRDLQLALLSKNDDDTYALDLSETFMNDEFSIMYDDDVTQSSYLGKMYKGTNDGTIFRIWLSETEIMDVTVNLNEINDDTDLSAVPVTVEKKSIVPAALPNPNKLTFEGAVTAEYDGSSEVSVDIPPADLVVTVTATSNDEYQSDTTFEQIRNASGDVRLILKGETDVHGNLIILFDGGAVFKITSDPSTNGYILIDSENTVHIEKYHDIYSVQITKLNNNTYVCNNTTFKELLEIINTTANVIVTYNGYVGYLETQPTDNTTAIAFNVIKDDAIVRILIDNTDNVTVKETPLGSNSFIVKVTPTSSNNDTTYSSDHSFSEIKEAYDKGLNPIVIYNNYAICQMVCINLLEAKFVSPSSSVESYNITIDKNNVAVDEFNIITSDKVIPDLDRVLDTMDPIYPSSYPVSAQAIGKLRDSIKESIPTKLSQLESRDYDSLENKPIVSINDLIDGDKFTYTETKPNAKGFVTRTYKFIINPDLDFNDRLFRVAVPDNVGNIMILIVTKKTDGSDYLTYYIMGAGNGEILAINTDKANKMMVVNRVFTGSRMLIEFDDTGCYKNSTSYFSVYKSDVLTKTNTVEFTPEKDYHPATKKYVDDTCEEYSSTARVEKTSEDTTAEIEPNKLYVFPEMASLTYALATPEDTSIANEYHFVFRSGATATELVNPSDVNVPDGFTVDKNKIYEVSILEGCMTYQSWAVS